MFAIVFIDISLTFCSTWPLKFWENVKSPSFYYLGENIYSISACVKYILFLPQLIWNFALFHHGWRKILILHLSNALECLQIVQICAD